MFWLSYGVYICIPIAITIFVCICTVHGFGGSRLYAQDTSDSHCNTNGEMIRMWINTTYAEEAPDCYVKQFT